MYNNITTVYKFVVHYLSYIKCISYFKPVKQPGLPTIHHRIKLTLSLNHFSHVEPTLYVIYPCICYGENKMTI